MLHAAILMGMNLSYGMLVCAGSSGDITQEFFYPLQEPNTKITL